MTPAARDALARMPAAITPAAMALVAMALGATVAVIAGAAAAPDSAVPCPVCQWRPPDARRVVQVGKASQLIDAVRGARPGTTILLADGDYPLSEMLALEQTGLVLRGKSGRRDAVRLFGGGMDEGQVGVALSVSAPDVTIADLTVGRVRYHGIQVRGESGASRVVVHNVHVIDTGQQLLKGSTARGTAYADDGLVACSRFEYTGHAPSNYTNGVDVLAGARWVVRDNTFVRIRGPQSAGWSAGPSILFWARSADTIVERNVILDSFRGIALGLMLGSDLARDGPAGLDHVGGMIRNNVVVNLGGWADEAIEANAAADVTIAHNTVLQTGHVPWSIGVRFPAAAARIVNNLTNGPILLRDEAKASREGNVSGAEPSWFVDAAGGDLRLSRAATPALGAGMPTDAAATDFDRQPRPTSAGADAGAFQLGPERRGAAPPPAPPAGRGGA